jgi:bacterioferritin
LIDSNLVDEEAHLDWLEAQLDQVKQMGLQNYLLGQTG